MNENHINEEIKLLQVKIKELGQMQPNGQIGVLFGTLYDHTTDIFEVILFFLLIYFLFISYIIYATRQLMELYVLLKRKKL